MSHRGLFEDYVGVFDSGVGGLSVWREIARQLPRENIVYLADQAHVPYGFRPLEEIRAFDEAVARFLLEQGVKAIVIACNTASVAGLDYLRTLFPGVPFVGMEPAVKPAAEQTQTGVIAVIATQTAFQGERFKNLLARYASGVQVLTGVGVGLVEAVEEEIQHVGDLAYAVATYLERSLHKPGEHIRCRIGGEVVEGTFLGFDQRGFLRLASNKEERLISAGKVTQG